MSNGLYHKKFSQQLSLPISLLIGFCFYKDFVNAFSFCYLACVLQEYINPDNDQFGLVTSEWNLIKKFPVLGWLWVAFWDLYTRIIPRHRHWLSHGIFIGTIFRFIYIYGNLLILSLFIPFVQYLLERLYYNPIWLVYSFLGFCFLDCGHILLDYHVDFRKWYESSTKVP